MAVFKLSLFGLAGYIDTRIGAYGGDALDRCDLPRRALDRAWQHLGRRYLSSEDVIIGDTRRDMQSASAIGAKAIGVATGTTSPTDLYAAGGDLCWPISPTRTPSCRRLQPDGFSWLGAS